MTTKAEYEQMIAFGNLAALQAGDIQGAHSKLNGSLSVIDEMQGEFAGAFQGVRSTVQAEVNRLSGALSGLGAKVIKAQGIYQTEQEAAAQKVQTSGAEVAGITRTLMGFGD